MAISETVLILAGGTAVLSIVFGIRLAMRAVAGGGGSARRGRIGRARRGRRHRAAAFDLSRLPGGGSGARGGRSAPAPGRACFSPAIWPEPCSRRAASSSSSCGTRRFLAAGTNIPPNLPTTALVVDGIYRRTRNPLYLGTTLVYLGLSVAAGSLWAIGLVVPLLWVINTGVIAREEHYLERKFGDAYRAYKARVRRWV